MSTVLTNTGVDFNYPENDQYASYAQNTSAKMYFTSIGAVSSPATNVSYYNGTPNVMKVNYAFYHPWTVSYDDAYIEVSPNNSTWYLAARQSNTRAGESYFNTMTAMVPPYWYYRGQHSKSAVQRIYYQY